MLLSPELPQDRGGGTPCCGRAVSTRAEPSDSPGRNDRGPPALGTASGQTLVGALHATCPLIPGPTAVSDLVDSLGALAPSLERGHAALLWVGAQTQRAGGKYSV